MFKSILVPVNLEDTQPMKRAMETAAYLARQDGAELHFISVFPGFGTPLVASFFPKDAEQKARSEFQQRLTAFVADTVPDLNTVTEVKSGNPWEAILDYAQTHAIDLIVMPCRHKAQSLLGSVSARVAERASCSVLISRG